MVQQAPPVNEVGLAIGFEPERLLAGPLLPEVLEPWFRDRGELSTAPLYVMPTETPLGNSAWQSSLLTMPVQDMVQEPRYWIVSADSAFVIQVQRNYLALNWRRRAEGNEYIHYEALRARFVEVVTAVQSHLSSKGRVLVPNKAELSYINLIYPNDLWRSPSDTHRLFAIDFPDEDEYEQLSMSYTRQVVRSDGGFAGRMYVALQSGVDAAKAEPLLNLGITARSGELDDESDGSYLDFLDRAHELANTTFLNLLRPEAARYWGLER